MEEIWTSARGGALVGLHKDVGVRNGEARMVSFEFLRIEATSSGVDYVAQPGGRPPTRFALVESSGRRAVFFVNGKALGEPAWHAIGAHA